MRVGASSDDSSKRDVPLTIPLMAESTAGFIKALNLPQKPDLYGWSLGGAVVVAMAALHGGAFRHGVVVNGWAGGGRSFVMPERSLDAFLSVRNNVTAVRLTTVALLPPPRLGGGRSRVWVGGGAVKVSASYTLNYKQLRSHHHTIAHQYMQNITTTTNNANNTPPPL